MLSTLPRLCLLLWLLRRAALVLALGTGVLEQGVPVAPVWIGVLGGGGADRFERALALQERHPEAVLAIAGTRMELVFAARLLGARAPGRIRYLEVEPGTTRGCIHALRGLSAETGILVTDESHAPRVRLAWLLAGIGRIPAIVAGAGSAGPDPAREVWKSLGYLVLY